MIFLNKLEELFKFYLETRKIDTFDALVDEVVKLHEQITYSSERQQQLMNSDGDRLITEDTATAIIRAVAKCGEGLTRDHYPSTRGPRRR